MSWRTLFGLILCNAIWSTMPIAGKVMMEELPPLQVSWLRYFFALASGAILLILLKVSRPKELTNIKEILTAWPWLLLTGLITFFCSAYVQYHGLSISTPSANSLIVAMEPLFAVLLAWVFLREKFKSDQVIGFIVAILGFCLLSNLKPHDLRASLGLFNIGNLFILVSMPSEAMYSIVSRKLAGRLTPMSLFAATLPIGFTAFSLFLICNGVGIPDFSSISLKAWACAAWMGVIGTTITYTYWSFALIEAPVAAVSLTLFVQPIAGTIWGTSFFGDRLDLWQGLGGLFILLALYIQTRFEIRRTT